MKIVALFSISLICGCTAMQPYFHADRDGYDAGVTGTWDAVATAVKGVIDPDKETLAK